jgi:hypothetical protein
MELSHLNRFLTFGGVFELGVRKTPFASPRRKRVAVTGLRTPQYKAESGSRFSKELTTIAPRGRVERSILVGSQLRNRYKAYFRRTLERQDISATHLPSPLGSINLPNTIQRSMLSRSRQANSLAPELV